ncbi:hypothetical protein V12B01_13290 [Vibrio splendidus 12B01]|nr:hypothetical protein V12B01_13290 [Vibrio splendidus 12B01]
MSNRSSLLTRTRSVKLDSMSV